jgi:CRISPR-associated endonuclease/helicase Cas3
MTAPATVGMSIQPSVLPTLAASEFAGFFADVRGAAPFPWQVDLCAEVTSNGRWPSHICIPSICDTAAVIEIAVFHLALEADFGEQRRAPVRIAHITDRLVVLDSILERARQLAGKLAEALDNGDLTHVTARLASRLAHLARSRQPLLARQLDSGVPAEGDWTPTPFQPTVLCTTVDHFGSRLLFRGFGLTTSMLSVQAGLLGADCLAILHEPQRSEAFRETLSLVDRYRHPLWCERKTLPWQPVTLRSMAVNESDPPFTLGSRDREDIRLSDRLRVAKPASLVLAGGSSNSVLAHARALVKRLPTRFKPDGPPPPAIVGLVVNTVELARACYTALSQALSAKSKSEIVLLTARSRGFDAAQYSRQVCPLLSSGPTTSTAPLYVIATQCIEVSTELQFDTLVTQIAPLDSLRLRFSHLNPFGRSPGATGVVVACKNEVSDTASDPLYGSACKATWDWLCTVASGPDDDRTVDFGINTMDAHFTDFGAGTLVCAPPHPPTLLPAHLDLLAQTSPPPETSPDVGLFIHGTPDTGDVQIVWRGDLDLSKDERVGYSIAAVEAAPPRPLEVLSLPVAAVRAWLEGLPCPRFGDITGPTGDYAPSRDRRPIRRPVLRWRGSEHDGTQKIYPRDLRGGDVIIVPCDYGGPDDLGWAEFGGFPGSAVRDISESLGLRATLDSPIVRLDRSSLEFELSNQKHEDDDLLAAETIWAWMLAVAVEAAATSNVASIATSLAGVPGLPVTWRKKLKKLSNTTGVTAELRGDRHRPARMAIIFVDPTHRDARFSATARDPSTTEFHRPPFNSPPVSIDEYARCFEANAGLSAHATGVDPLIVADLELAAALSPDGARDPRYQAYLRGGDRSFLYIEAEPILTATVHFASAIKARRARARAELPEQWCREAASVAMAVVHPRLANARDSRLVLMLIGTLFGRGRLFFPHADSANPGPQDPDWLIDGEDWFQIAATVQRRYGWWGLAHLEAVLRLAEHRGWPI